ncbi:MAG: SPASM domain-containing protein [Acidobacteriia bacterium]|nr:SPASM domain-containing protein [Terriglobia bacterium]
MKPSRYNRIFEASDGAILAFNGWSTALAEIVPEDLPFIRAMLADPDRTPVDSPHKREIREALCAARFLIEDDVDELGATVADMLRDRFRTDQLFLVIAPTLDCNFRCDYCYEDHLRVTMSRAVREALVRFVEERAATINLLHVTWFGGEPTLPAATKVVEALSEAFLALGGRHGFEYKAQLVTNGYLLDRARVEHLARLAVREVQVTVDGPARIHDRRRVLAGGQGTFARIVENLGAGADLAQFQLRINVDRRNAASALEVVEMLEHAGLARKVRPYLAQVTFAGSACGNIQETCFSDEEFARTEVELYREAARRGLPLSRYPFRLPGAFCTADRVTGFVVSPSGALFKCWHEVTAGPELAVGHLLDGEQPFHAVNEARWLAWNPLDRSECRSCSVLPVCHGGCPMVALTRPESTRGACEHYRYHLDPILEIQHVRGAPPSDGAPPRRGGASSEGA